MGRDRTGQWERKKCAKPWSELGLHGGLAGAQGVAGAALCLCGGRWQMWLGRCLPSIPALPVVLLSNSWPLCLFNKPPVGLPGSSGLASGSSRQRKGSRSASVGSSPGSRGALSLLIHKHWTSIKIIKGNQQPINNINSRTGRIRGTGEYWSNPHFHAWTESRAGMCFLY